MARAGSVAGRFLMTVAVVTLRFRDALRVDPTLVAEYAAVKQRLAIIHGADRAAYTAGKTDFIRAVTAAAGADGVAESAPVRS